MTEAAYKSVDMEYDGERWTVRVQVGLGPAIVRRFESKFRAFLWAYGQV